MENFFNYITKTINPEEVDIWFRVNNIYPEKLELFSDFTHSLNLLIIETYLGEEDDSVETKIKLTEEDNKNHFEWCWNKMLEDFRKENIIIKHGGEHKEYFKSFFFDTFYNQTEKNVKESIPNFLFEVFDVEKPFSKSDLDILTELYKLMEKNIE